MDRYGLSQGLITSTPHPSKPAASRVATDAPYRRAMAAILGCISSETMLVSSTIIANLLETDRISHGRARRQFQFYAAQRSDSGSNGVSQVLVWRALDVERRSEDASGFLFH